MLHLKLRYQLWLCILLRPVPLCKEATNANISTQPLHLLLWNQTLFKEVRKGFLLLYFFVKLWKILKKKSKLEISFQLYVKDTYDVIALTMATRQVHKKVLELYFSYWKLPQKLSRWPFMYFFGENLPKFFNSLESEKSYLVEFKIHQKDVL